MERSQTISVNQESVIGALRRLHPSERLLALYEYGIDGCAERDQEKVVAVLEELINILDFKYGEIADGFYRVYSFSLRKAQKGEFEPVSWLLQDLRDTWVQSLASLPAGTVIPGADTSPGTSRT
jgi:flagellin-specific chaperone FliS